MALQIVVPFGILSRMRYFWKPFCITLLCLLLIVLPGCGEQAADVTWTEVDVPSFDWFQAAGMTEEQVADLNEEFKKMDTRTGREQLNMLAEDAGKLGKKSKEDVLGFVHDEDVERALRQLLEILASGGMEPGAHGTEAAGGEIFG